MHPKGVSRRWTGNQIEAAKLALEWVAKPKSVVKSQAEFIVKFAENGPASSGDLNLMMNRMWTDIDSSAKKLVKSINDRATNAKQKWKIYPVGGEWVFDLAVKTRAKAKVKTG